VERQPLGRTSHIRAGRSRGTPPHSVGHATGGATALDSPVQYLKGVGPRRAEAFERLGVRTVRDLLWHLPRRYEDRRRFSPVRLLSHGAAALVSGRVTGASTERRRGLVITRVLLVDDSGSAHLTWYKPALHGEAVPRWHASGRLWEGGAALRCRADPQPGMRSGHRKRPGGDGANRADLPAHGGTQSAGAARLDRGGAPAGSRRGTATARRSPLPAFVRERDGYPGGFAGRAAAIGPLPGHAGCVRRSPARAWFVYEELFRAAARDPLRPHRNAISSEHHGHAHRLVRGPRDPCRDCARCLALRRSPKRRRARSTEIARRHGRRPSPMHRLLQGDVGLLARRSRWRPTRMAAAAHGGFQTALMAPTEILAGQHALSEPGRLCWRRRACAWTLSHRKRHATGTAMRCAQPICGAARRTVLVVGTHALIQESCGLLIGLVWWLSTNSTGSACSSAQALWEKGQGRHRARRCCT
jgi:ATP-dependent DNA helicase RecG